MARGITGIISLLALLGLAGCRGGYGAFVGNWAGMRPALPGSVTDRGLDVTARRVRLTVKDNGRFELIDAGLSFAGNIEGAGDDATLRIDTEIDRPYRGSVPGPTLKKLPNGAIRYEFSASPAPGAADLLRAAPEK